MTDIVERIRRLRFVHIPGTSDLMEEACQEIERLRQFDRPQPIKTADATPDTNATPGERSVQNRCTLTDDELEALEYAAAFIHAKGLHRQSPSMVADAATLRNLLERNDHDAVPDAIANAESVAPQPTAGDRSGNPTSHSGTGNTQKPVAWARFFPNGGPMSVFLDRPPADSEPLYRHPLCQDSLQKNLTEAEHDALEFVVETGRVAIHDEATLRNLLDRLHT